MKIPLKTLLYILPFFGFIFGYLIFFLALHNHVIIVPQIVGKNAHDAMITLSLKNLGMRLAYERIDDTLPEGTIIQQIPHAHGAIKPGQLVFVVLSKKTPPPCAPDLSGYTYEQLCKYLEKTSFKHKTVWVESAFPKNKFLGQYPLAKNEIADNLMTIFVSSGKNQRYVVPDFKYANLQKVIEALQAYKIEYELFGPLDLKSVIQPEQYTVYDQQPMAGSIVDLGRALTIHLHVGL